MSKDVIGGIALKNMFDGYASQVLAGVYISQLPREAKGDRRKYKVLNPLPSKTDYEVLRKKRFTSRLDDVISGAISELENLKDEVRGWYDNLTPGLQEGDRGQRLDECANILEGISEPDIPKFAEAMAIVAVPLLNCSSRSDRRDDCLHQLQQAVQALQDAKDADRFKLRNHEDGLTEHVYSDGEDADVEKDELQTLIDELESIINDVEGTEFPSMYG